MKLPSMLILNNKDPPIILKRIAWLFYQINGTQSQILEN
jgi:hypothetical protein